MGGCFNRLRVVPELLDYDVTGDVVCSWEYRHLMPIFSVNICFEHLMPPPSAYTQCQYLVPPSRANTHRRRSRTCSENPKYYAVRMRLFKTGKHGTPIRLINWRQELNWIFANS